MRAVRVSHDKCCSKIQDLLSGFKLGCGGKLCSALRTGLINLPRQGRRLTEISCIDRYEAWMMQDPHVFIKQASNTQLLQTM